LNKFEKLKKLKFSAYWTAEIRKFCFAESRFTLINKASDKNFWTINTFCISFTVTPFFCIFLFCLKSQDSLFRHETEFTNDEVLRCLGENPSCVTLPPVNISIEEFLADSLFQSILHPQKKSVFALTVCLLCMQSAKALSYWR